MNSNIKSDFKHGAKPQNPHGSIWREAVRRVWWWIKAFFQTLEDWGQNRWFQTFRLLITLAIFWWIYKTVHRESLYGADGILDLKQAAKDGLLTVGIASFLAIYWSDCISDIIGGVFMEFIDTSDHRAIETHPMDRLNQLIKEGKTSRARWLCRQMIRNKSAHPHILEAILDRLNDRRIRLGPPTTRIRGSN